jgi:hypothetical protein
MDGKLKRSGSYGCGHCGQSVSKTVYYQHKRLYYCDSTNSWLQANLDQSPADVEDFVFSEASGEDSEENVSEEGELQALETDTIGNGIIKFPN